jgi:hypothetical protein
MNNEIELNMWLLLKQADEAEDMGKEEKEYIQKRNKFILKEIF